MMDRRSFVKIAAGAAAGSMFGLSCSKPGPAGPAALAAEAAALRSLDKIGVQLYTVRSLMAQDFSGTLEAVAAAGYETVEFAGYFDHSPEEVRDLLGRLGLAAPAAHISLDALREDLAGIIAMAQTVGHRYLIAPWLNPEQRASIDEYRKHAAFFNEIGTACNDAGLRFGWHNHDFEFAPIDGTVPFDVLLDETDPELVDFEMDLFWTVKGGSDPLAYFERNPGRFALCHVKDMAADGAMVDVGAGEIDFKAIFARSEQAGLEHYFVEHDTPADPLASIKASYDHLAALQF